MGRVDDSERAAAARDPSTGRAVAPHPQLPQSPAIHAYAEAPTIVVETPAYVFPAHRASQSMLGPNRTLTSCPTTSYWVGRDAMHQRATQVQRMLKARVSVQILLGGFRWRGWVC